jgi:uncharacterized membrane protein YfcA
MQKAAGTSAACGIPIAFTAAVAYVITGWNAEGLPNWSTGFVYWPALVAMASTSMLFARLGVRLAHKLDPILLKRLFALMMLIIGCNFLFF